MVRGLPVHGSGGEIHNYVCFTIRYLISFLSVWKSVDRWGTSKGFTTTYPPERRIATVLFLLGNINNYCVHVHKNVTSYSRLQLASTSFAHCPFYLLWCDTSAPRKQLNLHKTNAANKRWLADFFTEAKPKKEPLCRLRLSF